MRQFLAKGDARTGRRSSPRRLDRLQPTCTGGDGRARVRQHQLRHRATTGSRSHDLVSYDCEAQRGQPGRAIRDGNNDNDTWNCGRRGADRRSGHRRHCGKRQISATSSSLLLLSQGRSAAPGPATSSGRTQRGNNNAYCQDNEITWLDWDLDDDRRAFLAFVRQVISLRAAEPVFRRRTFFHGRPIHGGVKDLCWIDADGREMTAEEWSTGWVDSLGMLARGR